MICPSLKISLLVALAFAATARAESGDGKAEPKNNRETIVDPKGAADEEAYRQARLKEQFEQFRSQLIRLAQRLEQSSDASNTDKAKVLRQAINKVNDLGIGAQGLGGLSTVLDVKIRTYPAHAANRPVAMIPHCAATRHAHFVLDGKG